MWVYGLDRAGLGYDGGGTLNAVMKLRIP